MTKIQGLNRDLDQIHEISIEKEIKKNHQREITEEEITNGVINLQPYLSSN